MGIDIIEEKRKGKGGLLRFEFEFLPLIFFLRIGILSLNNPR